MKSKRNLIILAIVIAISLIGVTYAFFDYYRLGANQKITAGKVNLILNDGTTTINLPNVFPETVEKARKEGRTDNVITFTVSGTNTTEDQDIYYEIMLNEGDPETGMTRFNPEDLVFDLIEVNGTEETYLVDAMSFSDFNERRIWVDTITKGTSTTKIRTYKLRMWLNEEVKVSDTNSSANYPATGFENYYASVKVSVYGDFVEKEMNYMANTIIDNLTLTEADVDGTRFVYGNVDNNYLWYSGKLWRIVSIDKDGNIKLVTQGDMTNIAWDLSPSNDYSTSQIRRWLNNEFLPTLKHKNLLVDSVWDYTTYDSLTTTKLTTTSFVKEKIGLINIYEYMMTGGEDSHLNNGYMWWTISPKYYSNSNSYSIWYITSSGSDGAVNAHSEEYGVRPSIVIKSGITILGGTGLKGDPYTIEGDKETGATSELLSNRVSGEYIKFDNTKYRIVGMEKINGETLTKVTMADYDVNKNSLSSRYFGDTWNDYTYNVSTGIGKYLNDWYNGTSINTTYKNMIATDGIKWYTGPDTGVGYFGGYGGTGSGADYTLSKTGTIVETPIGIGYYGEIFSSQFGDGYNASLGDTWLMTKVTAPSNAYIFALRDGGYLMTCQPGNGQYGVRPSFYLKSNVAIGDINGDGKVGTGMPHDPYEIVQLSE